MMGRHNRETLALRREALVARAGLQRVEFVAAVDRVRQRSQQSRGIGPLALRVVRALVTAPAPGQRSSPSLQARPLALSAGWLLVRALRVSPTARWIAGAVAVGGVVWWATRSLRKGPAERDDEADPDETGPRAPDMSAAGRAEGGTAADDASG